MQTLPVASRASADGSFNVVLQLKAAGRVPDRRDLLFYEENQSAGGALASSLQHRPATLFAGLRATGTRGLGGKELGV